MKLSKDSETNQLEKIAVFCGRIVLVDPVARTESTDLPFGQIIVCSIAKPEWRIGSTGAHVEYGAWIRSMKPQRAQSISSSSRVTHELFVACQKALRN